MECPSCGHANRAGGRFCDSCGTPLGSAPAVRPPARLAEKVRAGRGALKGERKQVTLSEHTAALSRATSSSLTWGFEVKGVTRPLRVYELAGVGTAHGRLDVSRARASRASSGATRSCARSRTRRPAAAAWSGSWASPGWARAA